MKREGSTAKVAWLFAFGVVLTATVFCTPKRLTDAGEEVVIVHRAPTGCQRLGEIEARQGGAVIGDFTSARDLEDGARNELRNRAAKLGANTVQIVKRDGMSRQQFAGSSDPNEVSFVGVGWRCSR
jgi:hypothetical protein